MRRFDATGVRSRQGIGYIRIGVGSCGFIGISDASWPSARSGNFVYRMLHGLWYDDGETGAGSRGLGCWIVDLVRDLVVMMKRKIGRIWWWDYKMYGIEIICKETSMICRSCAATDLILSLRKWQAHFPGFLVYTFLPSALNPQTRSPFALCSTSPPPKQAIQNFQHPRSPGWHNDHISYPYLYPYPIKQPAT